MKRLALVVAIALPMMLTGCGYKMVKKDASMVVQPDTAVVAQQVHQGETTITIKGKDVEEKNLTSVVTQLRELYGDPTATFQGFQDNGEAVILKVLHFDTGDDYEVVVHILNDEVKTIFSNLK